MHAQVSGRILDKATRQPVPYVSVALYGQPDTTLAVGGAVADSAGYFSIAGVKPGLFNLKTFFVGYRPTRQSLTVVRGQATDVGTIRLEMDATRLDEVRVSGQRTDVIVQADRQTFRAAQFQSAVGGTATDVLRNLPGLTVNAEGDVSLRGSNGFLVLLNGKPIQANLGTLLNQLPANSIESIEIITTPNARYDPDGKAGIIAIVTKTSADAGWSAQVNGMAGLPSVNDFDNARAPRRYSSDLTLNYRANRWDVTLGSAYIRNDIAGRRDGDASTTIGNRFTRFPSVGERSFDRYTFTNRLALAYVPNKANIWNLGLYQSRRIEERLADIFYDNTKTDLNTGQTIGRIAYFNSNLVRKGGTFYTANLDYAHTFLSKATLNAGALYEYDRIDGFTSNRNLNRTDYRDTLQYTRSTTDRPIHNVRTNLDAAVPVLGGKFETGYQYRYQGDEGDYRYRQQDGNGLPLLIVPGFTGQTNITSHIHSLYAQFGRVRKKLDYTLGLRYEYARRDVRSLPQNQTRTLALNNLFPSMNVLYTPKPGLSWRAGFSRRVQRTSNFALNPLPEREHSETLEQGDPNLLPEFVNLAEIGISKELGRSTLIVTGYYQGIQNVINRVNRVYADTILSRIFTNAGLAQRLGIETAADLKLTRAWKLYAGGTVYRYTQQGQLFENEVVFDRGAWVYSVTVNTTVQATPSLTVQANVNYLSRRITAQGEDSRFLTPNLSVKKSWLNNRLTVMAQWQNIGLGWLPTNEQRITTRGNSMPGNSMPGTSIMGRSFFTTTNYIQEKDIFLINMSYTFRQLSKQAKLPNAEGEKEF